MALKISEQGQLISVPVSDIWQTLNQITQWSQWNPLIRNVELLESPKPDAVGRIFPVFGSSYYFRIVAVTHHLLLKWERPYMLGTRLITSCTLTKNAEGAIATMEIWCEGAFDRTVRTLARRKLSEDLIVEMHGLKEHCEKLYAQNRPQVRRLQFGG